MLAFPPNPNYGTTFTSLDRTWRWDGFKWTVVGGAGGGIEDAPVDGNLYGRIDATWAQALSISGGTLLGSLTVNGDISASRGDGTGYLFFGGMQTPRYIGWDGANYFAGGRGVLWDAGNFNPATKLNTDGRITGVYFDGGSHMAFTIDNWWNQTIANYSDIPNIGAINNFVNSARWVFAGELNVPPYGWQEISGAVLTSYMAYGASWPGSFRFRYLQLHIPNAGWITTGFAS